MSLFQLGDFVLASGQKAKWKIECDVLTEDDWNTLAFLLALKVGPFSVVHGVPRGGIPLASALKKYRSEKGPVLVVDDVWTTGGSMKKSIEYWNFGEYIGGVVFARSKTPSWVTPLFRSYE